MVLPSKRCHLRHGVLASKQLVMPRRQKVMNHLEMVMMMMMMEMMKTQKKEQREKQQVQLLEERPAYRNW